MKLEPAAPPDALAAIQAPFMAMVATPLDAPVVQPLGLLLDLAGETLRERLFTVQGGAGPEACLRTEFTLPALIAHLDSGRTEGRYRYAGHAFRVAPPGDPRAEEFLQVGVEAFEPGDPCVADAEMVALAWRAAVAGGRDDLTVVLGDVSLFTAFVGSLGLASPLAQRLARAFSSPRRLAAELAGAETATGAAPGRLAALLAALPEAEAAQVLEEVWSLGGIEPVGGRGAAEIAHRLAERAALRAAPRLSEDQAGLIRRFLAIADRPAAALTAIAALAGASGPALETAMAAWRRRLAALDAAGVPAGRLRFEAAFGRAL
ncbi:MAG: ATP phosphoribosyltransferase regulatory subunit, partial [Caulobacteraceae bacterium]|nr:ATP phosphoribosyltransferase regulatory subunit [Caulobacteraceae bacterium]